MHLYQAVYNVAKDPYRVRLLETSEIESLLHNSEIA